MTPIVFSFLILFVLINFTNSTDIEVNGFAIEKFRASGSLDDVEILIQEEAQVVNTLIELDNQLTTALDHASSASEAVEIDVVVGESDDSISGSKFQIDDEILVIIPPGPKLSDEEKNKIKAEIENEVANTLDEIIVNDAIGSPEMEQKPLVNKVERLFEEEAEAEKELVQMQEELEKALDELPSKGPLTEIDIVVTESDDKQEVIDDEIAVIIPASTGSGPRLMEEQKEELEEEVVMEAADALGNIIMDDFVRDEPEQNNILGFPASPQLQEVSPRENTKFQRTSAPFADETTLHDVQDDVEESEPKPALRGAAAMTTAHTGFNHPMFVPHHWQTPSDEQLWTMKLSMLTSISCLTLLLIVGVWTGVRRTRRAVLNDSNFRWADAVEYMDAFPYES